RGRDFGGRPQICKRPVRCAGILALRSHFLGAAREQLSQSERRQFECRPAGHGLRLFGPGHASALPVRRFHHRRPSLDPSRSVRRRAGQLGFLDAPGPHHLPGPANQRISGRPLNRRRAGERKQGRIRRHPRRSLPGAASPGHHRRRDADDDGHRRRRSPGCHPAAVLRKRRPARSEASDLLRRNWGVKSNDYGDAAGVITYRRGISQYLTLETHAESTRGLQMAGVGAVMNVGNFALLNVAAAGSSFNGRSGGQLSAGIQRVTPTYSLGGSATVANRRFGDIAAANGDPVSTFQLNANASVSLSSFGSLGIAYSEIRRASQPAQPKTPFANAFDFVEPQHSRILTASYSRQFGRMAVYATVFRDFGEKKGTHVMVGLTLPLGRRTSVSASAQASSGSRFAQVEVDRPAVSPGEWGFRAFASGSGGGNGGMSDHEFGQVTYKSGFGQVYAGVDQVA